VERANELAGELSTAIASREKFENRVKVLEAASTHHTEEVASLESQLLDRDAQCKSLVRELAIRDDPTLAYVAFNATSEIKEGDPITDRLLLFKSLPALQEQNGKLLKIVRALQARLSDRETKRATAEDNGALDEAADTITTLHTKLVERQNVITDLQAKIMEITRERDVFSRLLSRGEGLRWPNGASSSNGPVEDSSAEAISSLQAELDVVRKKADEDVTEAKKLARQKSEEAGNSEVERAKAEAKATMLSEQNRLLSETHAHQKQENTTLEAQVRQLQSQISQVQQERRKVGCIDQLHQFNSNNQALDEVAMHQTAEGRLRDEASQLRAGKEQWESMQTRMQADFTIVQQERANLQHLIDNLKGINSESGRTRTEELTRLEKRIEELQREA
jgi:nucleoprotein TPR